jgi:outer membrane protein assembly factor BamE (lipoprotein component of BamABCDE complex)
MNSKIAKLLLGLGVALALGACASADFRPDPSPDQVAQIQPGLTQDQVRTLLGSPGNVTGHSVPGGALWIYSFDDEYGYPSEFDVTFARNGVVASTYAERAH